MWGVIGTSVAKVGLSLLTSLLTEAFIKRMLVAGLEAMVKRTDNDTDDKVLQAAKDAWGLHDGP